MRTSIASQPVDRRHRRLNVIYRSLEVLIIPSQAAEEIKLSAQGP